MRKVHARQHILGIGGIGCTRLIRNILANMGETNINTISISNNGGAVEAEAGAIGAEGLKRQDASGTDVGAAEQRLKGFQYRSIGGLGQQTQQAAQDSRDRKCPVTVWNGSQYFSGKFLGKEDGAFGLAAAVSL